MNKPLTLRNLLFTLIFTVITTQISAQVFQKNYSLVTGYFPVAYNFAESVQQTSDGGFIIQGWNMSAVPKMELIKTNNLGVISWKKEYSKCLVYAMGSCFSDDPTSSTMGGCVQQTSDGGYILCGSLNSSMVLIKTNSAGDVGTSFAGTWAKTYGTSSYGKYVRQTIDGGYICVGYSGNNVYIVKTANNGTLQWDREYQISSNYNDQATDVEQLASGDFVVTGYTTEIYNPGPSADTTSDIFIIKLASDGTFLWTDTYGQDDQSEEGHAIRKTADGGYIISGHTSQTNSTSAMDAFLWKFNAIDAPEFQYNYKLGGNFSLDINFGYAAQQTLDGGYAVFGVITSYGLTSISYFNNYLLKLDNAGDPVFCKTYKDSISGGAPFSLGWTIWNDGKQLSNGGYIIGGSGIPMSSGSGLGYKLIKTNSVGESGCSENSLNPSRYSFAPPAEPRILTNVATSIVADVNLSLNLPTVTEEEVCIVTCKAMPGNDTTICQGSGAFQLGENPAAINGTPPYTYTWSPATDLSATNIPNPIYTPTTDAVYTLAIEDSEGCTSEETITITQSPLPTADAGTDQDICGGTSATLSAVGTPPGSTFTWNNGVGNGAVVTVSPTTNTTYIVSVADAFNCGTATSSVNINVFPAATVTSGPDTVCAGDVFTTNASVTNSSSVLWSTSGTGTFSSSTAQNPTYTPSTADVTAGSVTLSVNVSGIAPCGDTTGQILLTIKPLPAKPVFSNILPSHCENDAPFTLTGGSPSGGTYSGLGVSNNMYSPIVAGSGTHPIIYTISDINGCMNADTNTISIIPLPVVTLDSFTNVCVTDNSIILNGGLPLGGNYFGDGVTDSLFDPSDAGVGLDTIFYTFINNIGCSDTAFAVITVVPSVTLTSDAPGDAVYVDLGQVVNFTATPNNAGTYAFGIDAIVQQTSAANTYATNTLQAGQIVYVTLNNACKDSISINVKPVPNAFIPFTNDGSNDIFMPNVDLTILNRWGEEIYKGTAGWDGKYKGQNVSPGTYFYIIKIVGLDSVEKQFTGIVTLVAK